METTPDLFQTWHDSSTQLEDAIQRYHDASLALKGSITTQSNNSLKRGALDELFTSVRIDLGSFSSRSIKLKTAGAILKGVLNQNTKSTPIQSLPGDVLVYIFLPLTRGQCNYFPTSNRKIEECQITKMTVRITHVCADWRRLAINTPSLWSHLDMVDDKYGSNQSEGLSNSLKSLWLERSGNTPLALLRSI